MVTPFSEIPEIIEQTVRKHKPHFRWGQDRKRGAFNRFRRGFKRRLLRPNDEKKPPAGGAVAGNNGKPGAKRPGKSGR
ncbi:MAG: hypothetical protein NTT76_01875, partial [Achromobacter xylosoxidans]|nr:hypothetical protein [Achromobacter xylosoxidans]